MKPVFMMNDLGGIVYVGKNSMCILFAVGVEHEFRIDTKELLCILEKKKPIEWETEKFLIETLYKSPEGSLNVIITVKFSEQDDDKAVVLRCDLIDALIEIERPTEKTRK